jgi:hypothetical protein
MQTITEEYVFANIARFLQPPIFPNVPFYNVADLGAKPGKDCTKYFIDATQQALKTNGAVYIPPTPPGFPFYVDRILIDSNNSNANNIVRFTGAGEGSVVKLIDGSVNVPFFITNIAGVTFDNFCIDGNKANCPSALYGARTDIDDVKVYAMKFLNCVSDGIFGTPATATLHTRFSVQNSKFIGIGSGAGDGFGIALEQYTNVSIIGNLVEGCSQGICDVEPFGATDTSSEIVIIGNVGRNSGSSFAGGAVILVHASNASFDAVHNVIVSLNTIYLCQQYGIRISDITRFILGSNNVNRAGKHGIYTTASLGACQFGNLNGNNVKNCGESAANTYDGINCDVLRDSTIGDNNVADESTSHRNHLRIEDSCQRVAIGVNGLHRSAATAKLYIGTGTGITTTPLVGLGTDRGDNSVTIIALTDDPIQRFDTALTANRTVTLSATDAYRGAKFTIIRHGLGNFTLNVGGLKTIPGLTAAKVEVMHDGTAWFLYDYSLL